MPTLKGFCTANESPQAVNALAIPETSPALLRIWFGEWCWNPNIQYVNAKWMWDISDASSIAALTVESVARAANHPNNSHIVLLHNEPYLGDSNDSAQAKAEQCAVECVTWMDIILQGDPLARFALAGGDRTTAPHLVEDGSFLELLWNALPFSKRKKVDFVHFHYYDNTLKRATYRRFVKRFSGWMEENMPSRLKLILGETGAWGYVENDPKLAKFLYILRDVGEEFGLHVWCWWNQMPLNNTNSLLDGNYQRTSLGNVFAGM